MANEFDVEDIQVLEHLDALRAFLLHSKLEELIHAESDPDLLSLYLAALEAVS